jgi:hypothetical protein
MAVRVCRCRVGEIISKTIDKAGQPDMGAFGAMGHATATTRPSLVFQKKLLPSASR